MTPEQRVRKDVRHFMEDRGWKLWLTHGNKFQKGLPDAYALHIDFGERWIDFKVARKYTYTEAQKNTWCDWYFNFRKGVYILTKGTQEEYDKLFKPPNFLDFWRPSWGTPEEFAKPFDPLELVEMLEGEWLPIKDFTKYHISNDGRIFSECSGRLLTPEVCESEHLRVTLSNRSMKKRFFVHTLVLGAFVRPSNSPSEQCCHLDSDPSNNSVDNLMWGSAKENALHRSKVGNTATQILVESQVLEIVSSKDSIRDLTTRFGVSANTISSVLKGHTWSWLTGIQPAVRSRRSPLSDEIVIQIFNSSGTHRKIAKEFNINHSTVGAIKRRQIHKSLTKTL